MWCEKWEGQKRRTCQRRKSTTSNQSMTQFLGESFYSPLSPISQNAGTFSYWLKSFCSRRQIQCLRPPMRMAVVGTLRRFLDGYQKHQPNICDDSCCCLLRAPDPPYRYTPRHHRIIVDDKQQTNKTSSKKKEIYVSCDSMKKWWLPTTWEWEDTWCTSW